MTNNKLCKKYNDERKCNELFINALRIMVNYFFNDDSWLKDRKVNTHIRA